MARTTNIDGDRDKEVESVGLVDKFIALIDNPSEERLSNVAAELEALSDSTGSEAMLERIEQEGCADKDASKDASMLAQKERIK